MLSLFSFSLLKKKKNELDDNENKIVGDNDNDACSNNGSTSGAVADQV